MSEWSASSNGVDAVLFDLGNTLVAYYRAAEFAPVLERCIAAGAEVLRERPGLGAVDRAAAHERALVANAERTDHRVRPLEERLLEVFGLDARGVPGELVARLGDAFLRPIFATARLDAAALDVLSEIKRLGIKTAIVSNTPWGSPAGVWRGRSSRATACSSVSTRRCSASTSAGASPRRKRSCGLSSCSAWRRSARAS